MYARIPPKRSEGFRLNSQVTTKIRKHVYFFSTIDNANQPRLCSNNRKQCMYRKTKCPPHSSALDYKQEEAAVPSERTEKTVLGEKETRHSNTRKNQHGHKYTTNGPIALNTTHRKLLATSRKPPPYTPVGQNRPTLHVVSTG